MARKNRFAETLKEATVVVGVRIFTDTETAVQYLFRSDGYAGGMCVLVDKDGKPLLNPEYAGGNGPQAL